MRDLITCPYCDRETELKLNEFTIKSEDNKKWINLLVIQYYCCDKVFHTKELGSSYDKAL
jgi:hypothetical protein